MATLRKASISLIRLAGATNIVAALRPNQAHLEKIITLLANENTTMTELWSANNRGSAVGRQVDDLAYAYASLVPGAGRPGAPSVGGQA
jgi:hypothetical protein